MKNVQALADQEALANIATLAAAFAERQTTLYQCITDLQLEVDRLKRAALPMIKAEVAQAVAVRDELKLAIEAVPELFVKPRTRVFAGVRVGFAQSKPKVEFAEDEDATIQRIRERLPAHQVELLIRKEESVVKSAVVDLQDVDLKRLGIKVTGGDDYVVVKAQDGDVAKLVDALLAAGDKLEEL